MNNSQLHIEYIPAQLQVKLFAIARKMSEAGLPDEFVALAVTTALEYDGIAQLMVMWAQEPSHKEKDEIIADIQELIDDCQKRGPDEYPTIKFSDLDKISENIRAFKDSLLALVNEKSSINELSKSTGIPQPSLSRFFNSASMPRRSTLLKLAKALRLDAVKITTRWSV